MRNVLLGVLTGVSLLATRGFAQQPDADSVPLTRRMLLAGATSYYRVGGSGGVWNEITGSFAVRSFVNDAIQVGVAPSYQAGRSPTNHNWINGYGSGTVNFGVNIPFGLRAYAGGYSFTFLNSRANPWYRAGVQAGVMRFFGPSLALRLEQRWYGYSSNAFDPPITETILSLDPYLIRDDPVRPALPGWGTVEIAGYAYAMTAPWDERNASLTIAPFLTSWLQVGTDLSVTSEESSPAYAAHSEDAMVRLYAPYSPAFMPFIGGTVATNNYGTWFSSYSGSIGVRHALDRAIAADVGTSLTGYRGRSSDQFSIFAKLVLLMRTR